MRIHLLAENENKVFAFDVVVETPRMLDNECVEVWAHKSSRQTSLTKRNVDNFDLPLMAKIMSLFPTTRAIQRVQMPQHGKS